MRCVRRSLPSLLALALLVPSLVAPGASRAQAPPRQLTLTIPATGAVLTIIVEPPVVVVPPVEPPPIVPPVEPPPIVPPVEPPPIAPPVVTLPPEPPAQVAAFHLHHDTIPNVAQAFTIRSVTQGAWSDPASWFPAHVPTATDLVVIAHTITYDSLGGDVDTIGVAAGGTLAFSLTQSTRLTLRTLLVQPQGTLQIGTVAAPLPAQFTAEIVLKDLPIDLVKDPAQYGHGVLAIDGTVSMHGDAKALTFVRLAAEPHAGDTTLRLAQAVAGWQVGDRLVVPDTRQLSGAEVTPHDQTTSIHRRVTQTEVVTIAAVNGLTLTLTTPVQFDHLGARDTAGRLDFLPHVGNLTRNIVIRSANPAGTRGHTLFTGVSDVDVRYVAFTSLGRTKAEPLDSTVVNPSSGVVTHLGKNQLGRYPLHNHHNFGPCTPVKPYQVAYVGNVVEDTGRWGMTVHGSHYGLYQDNVIYNVKGAGIAAEEGSETGNLFENNFVVRVENTTPLTPTEAEGNADPLGRKGNGFWLRGMNNMVRNNVVADTREGFGLYVGSAEGGPPDGPEIPVNLPKTRCSNTTLPGQYTTVDMLYKVPNAEFSGNEAYSTSEMGVGVWVNTGLGKPFTNLTLWHNYGMSLFMKYTDPRIDGLTIRNKNGQGIAIRQQNNFGYGAALISHADIQGVDVLWQRGGQITLPPNLTFADGYFVSRRGFQLDANGQANGADISSFVLVNPRFAPLPGFPLKAITTTFLQDGDKVNIRRSILVRGYQGNPADTFRVFFAAQAPAAPVYYLRNYPALGPDISGCPVTVARTNQQCWDQYQIATFRELAPCTDTTTHPEITGFSCQ